MSDIGNGDGTDRPIDPAALAHIQRRWARAAEAPWLHGEVARRLAERLAVIRARPATVLDWCSTSGASTALLAHAYPEAVQLRARSDCVAASPTAPPPWWSPRRWRAADAAAVAQSSLMPACSDLLWANMCLHVMPQPMAQLRRWHALLRVDGFLMFTTLGPGSLSGLRELFAREGWGPAFAPFVDMHDLGDMLVHAGFADPVMDQEILTLSWPDAAALLAELRSLGGNADALRHRGLRTPRWRERLQHALRSLAGADGRLRLDFEVVYGHAFKVAAGVPVAAHTVLPLEQMRSMVRRRR